MVTVKYRHACPEWDFLLIDERFAEFESCICFSGNEEVEQIQENLFNDRNYFSVVESLNIIDECLKEE
jgi:hypothetical protein